MKVFLVDVDRCVGCHSCQIVCKDEHCDNDWMPYAKPQPDTGQFWLKVNDYERGQVPKVKVTYVPVMCQHCEDAPCQKACEHDAYQRRVDGLLLLDPAKCTGCGKCAEACPYDAVFKNEELGICQKCTGCAHLLDEGWETPRCVDSCAHDAIRFGEYEDFAAELEAAGYLKPEEDTKPHVYYLNLPKRFLAGEVADLEIEEVLIGATVVLTDIESGAQLTTTTDEFGDFWFNQIAASDYQLEVSYDGYMTRTVKDFISTKDKDLNVGTIALYAVK